jgi:hypothetical protein
MILTNDKLCLKKIVPPLIHNHEYGEIFFLVDYEDLVA